MEGNKMAGAVHAGIETAGLLDIDSELVLVFSNGAQVHFEIGINKKVPQRDMD